MTREEAQVLSEIDEDVRKWFISEATPEERLEGLSPDERLEGLSPEDRLEGLSPEERDQMRRLLVQEPRE